MLVTLKDILNDAQKNKYAVGLFNAIDNDMLEATISAAEEMNSPVIIGTAEVLLKYGELQTLGPMFLNAAKNAKVPVAVHYDHGLTFEKCMEALKLGFSSVMFDGSAGDEEENLKITQEIVKVAHAMDATVEGEIGYVGFTDVDDFTNSDMYTTPEQAIRFVESTGVDALAIAIGTAHGKYSVKPELDIERLKLIRESIDTPLVLHGGSGLSDDDFRNTIANGITKINIYTDLTLACEKAIKASNDSYIDIRDRKKAFIKEMVTEKLKLFGSCERY